jgi:hypothetical protein
LDDVVRRGVNTAGTAAAVTGTDVLQKVRKGMTVIQAQGYSPSVLAIDPAGAEALDLLQTAGSEKFCVWGPGRATPTGPFGLTMRVWKNAGTALLDADAFGRLYVAPVELRSFEQDAGATNRQTFRWRPTRSTRSKGSLPGSGSSSTATRRRVTAPLAPGLSGQSRCRRPG